MNRTAVATSVLGILGIGVVATSLLTAPQPGDTRAPATEPTSWAGSAPALQCDLPEMTAHEAGDSRTRDAADRGLAYLARASKEWTAQHRCFGCHVQAVTLEALATATSSQYRVATDDLEAMIKALEMGVTAGGRVTGVAFEASAWARYDRFVGGAHTEDLLRYAGELVQLQNHEGAIVDDDARRPITGGTMQTTYQAAQAWRQAYARTADETWLTPLQRAEYYLQTVARSWPDGGEGVYIQDINFALMGLSASGVTRSEAASVRLQEMLLARQRNDGGFSLDGPESDAFATGQTVYALKLAGFSDGHPAVARGLAYLLAHQEQSGAWSTYRSNQTGSEKGETMWAVLGLTTVDVASITISGLIDGQRVKGRQRASISASDSKGREVVQLEALIDDRPLDAACGATLALDWSADELTSGKHILELVATTADGRKTRRALELYAGDVYLTQLGARFDPNAGATSITLRNVAHESDRGEIRLEVWSVDDQQQPKTRLHQQTLARAPGPLEARWGGETDDGAPAGPGAYMAKLVFVDGDARLQEVQTLFFQGSSADQRASFGEIGGQLSLEQGARGSANTILELVDERGRVVQTTRTTEQGNYRFKNVIDGRYRVRTQKDGFRQLESEVEAAAGAPAASSNMSW
ncbi:MAG: carboxypeptidase regulatory-like domain-containing protein [Myxococcales bacterium]|nr:carboxypeptidase regulatory-like domain-containing protein [Myxococcales bacterium]